MPGSAPSSSAVRRCCASSEASASASALVCKEINRRPPAPLTVSYAIYAELCVSAGLYYCVSPGGRGYPYLHGEGLLEGRELGLRG